MKRLYLALISILALELLFVLGLPPTQASAQSMDMMRVIVGFTRSPNASDEKAIRAEGGAILHRYNIVPAIAAQVPRAALPKIRSTKWVAYMEEDGQVQALEQTVPWGIDRIGAQLVHSYDQGKAVKVAIIDTGIDLDHPDLQLNIKGGINTINTFRNADDDNGHGTHVAGIVSAVDNDFGVVGVAPQAWLYAVKVLDSRGSGYWSDVIEGIQWAVDHGIQVINMSLGSSSGSISLKQACDTAYNKGVLLVAAAGNRGAGSDTVVYPAKYDSVIAVAATDSLNNRASFSSTGPAVELAAPGKEIYSTYYQSNYGILSGTSMASPHVAGVAAMIISSGIADSDGDGMINDDVRLRLQQTATDLGSPGRDYEYGYGLVNAPRAVPPPVNHPPVANAGRDQTAMLNTPVSLDGSASFDPDGDPLTYIWTQSSGPSARLSDVTAVRPTFTPTEVGIYTFSLVTNDGKLSSAPDEVLIKVSSENNPPSSPVVDITPDPSLTTDDLLCEIITPSTDIDGDLISYSYSWYKNGMLQIGLTSNSVDSSYTAKGEVWRCEVAPYDGFEYGAVGADEVTIANSPPLAEAGPDLTVMVNTTVTLSGSASSDPDGDQLSYRWTQTAGTGVTLSDSTAVKPTFTPGQGDTYAFELEVSDGSASGRDVVYVYVTGVPVLKMHVEVIEMSVVKLYGGWRTYATSRVTVFDVYRDPVEGATVSGHWEGAASGRVSGTTNSSGQVTFASSSLSFPPSGTTFTFVLDNLSKDSWTYDTSANKQSRNSVAIP